MSQPLALSEAVERALQRVVCGVPRSAAAPRPALDNGRAFEAPVISAAGGQQLLQRRSPGQRPVPSCKKSAKK